GNKHSLFPLCRFRIAECSDPLIHCLPEFICGPESVNSHGAEKMAGTFAGLVLRHRQVSHAGRHERAEVGSAEESAEYVNHSGHAVPLVASVQAIAPQSDHSPSVPKNTGVIGRISLGVLNVSQRYLLALLFRNGELSA